MAKILLVEDDTDLQAIYSARLEAEGYTVLTANDGEAGLATAMREAPDLIILDAMMPKIDGFDVLDMLRQTPQTEHTCIIMMTALGQDDYRKRGEALGVNRYFVKSQVSLDDLVAAVKQTLADGEATAKGATITPESPVLNQVEAGPINVDASAAPAPAAPAPQPTPAAEVPVAPVAPAPAPVAETPVTAVPVAPPASPAPPAPPVAAEPTAATPTPAPGPATPSQPTEPPAPAV